MPFIKPESGWPEGRDVTNLRTLQSFKQSPAWYLVVGVLTEQMDKALVPPMVSGTMDEIAIASISRSASYQALRWVRDDMLKEMIERERKASQE